MAEKELTQEEIREKLWEQNLWAAGNERQCSGNLPPALPRLQKRPFEYQ